MRPRTELGLSAGFLLGLGLLAVAAGSRRDRSADRESGRSTYLTGPAGGSAFAEAAAGLGVQVERYRRPTATLEPSDTIPTVVAVLGPREPLTPGDARHLLALPVDLLLAGPGAEAAIRCFGYRVVPRPWRDSMRTRSPEDAEHLPAPRVVSVLVAGSLREVVDSAAGSDGRRVQCEVPQASRVDTLLETLRERPVVLRLSYPGGRRVTLVADDGLFRNRTLRRTLAGGFVLGLVADRYDRLIVDEYHHGYMAAGSLGAAALAWSTRSPWGWMVWQLVAVGLVALVASGVRFGPVRSAIERRRRSPMEHVRALATTLAAARGHDVAVRLMVQGLRRRLSRGGRPAAADLDAWLESLGPSVRSDRGREALKTLTGTLRTPPDAASVLAAGNAVETLWEELKPT
ncbi:MAG TPA: DUF4350 domain-containing protein [Gemmatimonadales bacterium]|jgi:hypothetical protein